MTQETEGERINRIHNAQIDARSNNSVSSQSQFQVKRGAARPKVVKPLVVELFEILPRWAREVTIGTAAGLLPALVIAILLPGAFKLVSVLVLLVCGGAGYLIGEHST